MICLHCQQRINFGPDETEFICPYCGQQTYTRTESILQLNEQLILLNQAKVCITCQKQVLADTCPDCGAETISLVDAFFNLVNELNGDT